MPCQEALDQGHHDGFSWWRSATLSPQTLEEISELHEDLQHLEEDLRRKLQNLKLCHTRLESRTYRPNVELCRDQVRGHPTRPLDPDKVSWGSLPSTYSWQSKGAAGGQNPDS